MKNIVKHITWVSCLLFSVASCSIESEELVPNAEEAVIHLSLPSNESTTRVSLKESENSLDLTTQWKNGDEVDIFAVYEGKVEYIGAVPARDISEDGKSCNISYKKPKFVEDGDTEEYTLIGVVGAKTSYTETEVYCNASLQRVPFKKFKVPAVFSIVTGFNQSNAVFKPYGVYEILHIKNTSDEKINFSLNGFEANPTWFRIQGAIRFSDGLFVDEAEAAQPYSTSSDAVSIPAQDSDAIVSWYLPNGNLIKDAVISANINGKTVKSSNQKSSYVQIELEHAYHMYATWDGKELKFGEDEAQPQHEGAVDLGLPSGTQWAKCNMGANSPEELGEYYAWGETSTKATFSWKSYKYSGNTSNSLTKYCTKSNYGKVDNKTQLEPADDKAKADNGNDWSIPSKEDWEELMTYCNWEWKNNGVLVSSKKNSIKSIWLPAAGYYSGYDCYDKGSECHYWSSTLDTYCPDDAWYMNANSGKTSMSSYYRYQGRSIRPVIHKTN